MSDRRTGEENRSLLDEQQVIQTNYSNEYSANFSRKSCRLCLVAGVLIVVVGFGLGFGLYYGLKDKSECDGSCLGSYCSPSKLGVYHKYAISVDTEPCAPVGKRILEKGGNAVDSIIAVLLCMGVTIPESMGLGGGHFATIYNATSRTTFAVDAREWAPSASSHDMYNKTDFKYSVDGPLAIAVPGELAGYWHMFTNHGSGRISWSQLFEDAIDMCEKGFNISEHFATALRQKEPYIWAHKELRDVYVNNATKKLYQMGELLVQKTLGATLRRIASASNPMTFFYEELAQQIVEDIYKADNWTHITPIITVEDFKNYSIEVRPPVVTHFKLKNLTLHSFPLPASGDVLSFIMQVMEQFPELYPRAAHSVESATLFYHRLVETYKFAFAQRMHLGDSDDGFDVSAREIVKLLRSEEFVRNVSKKIDDSKTFNSSSGHYDSVQVFFDEDHGTAHVSIVDAEGNAVGVTTTVNSYFGSKVMSASTGILMNNEMDDFNTGAVNDFGIPPSDKNLIAPFKRPLSSMCPTVFTDQDGLRLVIGGSGGPMITTAVASVAIRNLWFDEDIKTAIDGQRLHHQLYPDMIIFEKYFPHNILDNLSAKGHELRRLGDNDRGAIIMAVSRVSKVLYANSDYRKGGTVDGE